MALCQKKKEIPLFLISFVRRLIGCAHWRKRWRWRSSEWHRIVRWLYTDATLRDGKRSLDIFSCWPWQILKLLFVKLSQTRYMNRSNKYNWLRSMQTVKRPVGLLCSSFPCCFLLYIYHRILRLDFFTTWSSFTNSRTYYDSSLEHLFSFFPPFPALSAIPFYSILLCSFS